MPESASKVQVHPCIHAGTQDTGLLAKQVPVGTPGKLQQANKDVPRNLKLLFLCSFLCSFMVNLAHKHINRVSTK